MASESAVIIPVELDTKRFDRQIAKVESQLKQEQKELKEVKEMRSKNVFKDEDFATTKIEKANVSIEKLKNKLIGLREQQRKATEQQEKLNQALIQASVGNVKNVGYNFNANIAKGFNLTKTGLNGTTSDNLAEKTEYMASNVKEMSNGFNEASQNAKKVKNELPQTSSHLGDILRKVAKWGLALFGIRSAYNFIRSSVSALSISNEQIGSDIEYIRWALAVTLQPIIEGLIKLAFTFLTYINYIANAWFGVNLFANASADAFKRAKDNVKGTNTEAKKLQKTLAGFDEMNILQENGSVSGGGGGGGIALPTTDLSQMLGETEIPGWVEWIATHGNEIRDVIIGIVEAIALFKFAELAGSLIKVADGFKFFKDGMLTLSGAITAVGIVVMIKGIADALKDFENLIKEPSWDNFITLIGDLSVAIEGLGIMLIGLNASNPFGWITLAIGAIGMLVSAISGATDEVEEEQEKVKDLKLAYDELEEARHGVTTAAEAYTKAVKQEEEAHKKLVEIEKKNKISGEQLYTQIKNNELSYKDLKPKQREVLDAYIEEQKAKENLEQKTREFNSSLNEEKNKVIEVTSEQMKQYGTVSEVFKKYIDEYRQGKVPVYEFEDTVLKIFQNLDDKSALLFADSLPDDIFKTIQSLEGLEGVATKQFTTLDKILNWSKLSFDELGKKIADTFNGKNYNTKSLTSLIDNIAYSFEKMKYKLSTLGIKITSSSNAKGGIVTRLATGGIVNQPSRGVPLAGAIAGEAGREGIIPLTDSQAMETLGQAIGKYISINATIPISVGNRQIAREIRKIEAEDDFAYNS